MKCPKCGSEVGEKRNYCPFCGFRLSIPFSPQQYIPKRSKPVSISSLIIPILAIIAVVIAIMLIFAFGGSNLAQNPRHSLSGLEITDDGAVELLDHIVVYVSVTNGGSQTQSAWVIAQLSLNDSLAVMYEREEIVLDPGQTMVYSFTFYFTIGEDLQPRGFEYVTYLSETYI